MTRFKDFGSGPDLTKIEAPTFALHGENFEAVPVIQGKVLMDLIRESQSDDVATSTEVADKFFAKVLTDESYERFSALINSKDKIVEVETLGEIVGWLVEEYSKRPEEPRED